MFCLCIYQGAAGLAAVIHSSETGLLGDMTGLNIVCVLSGGNVSVADFAMQCKQ